MAGSVPPPVAVAEGQTAAAVLGVADPVMVMLAVADDGAVAVDVGVDVAAAVMVAAVDRRCRDDFGSDSCRWSGDKIGNKPSGQRMSCCRPCSSSAVPIDFRSGCGLAAVRDNSFGDWRPPQRSLGYFAGRETDCHCDAAVRCACNWCIARLWWQSRSRCQMDGWTIVDSLLKSSGCTTQCGG